MNRLLKPVQKVSRHSYVSLYKKPFSPCPISSKTIKAETILRCPGQQFSSNKNFTRLLSTPFITHVRKLIIRPRSFSYKIDFPLCTVVRIRNSPTLNPSFLFYSSPYFFLFRQGHLIGGVWQSRINGDLIKDYSSTKIKINLTLAVEEKNKRSRGGSTCDVEAVCSSTSWPTALIIRWRQMEGEYEKGRG